LKLHRGGGEDCRENRPMSFLLVRVMAWSPLERRPNTMRIASPRKTWRFKNGKRRLLASITYQNFSSLLLIARPTGWHDPGTAKTEEVGISEKT